MIIDTNGIVLRTIDYHETSKIVTLLTQKQGKIAVIAKGAKRLKSKFAGLIETGNILEVTYFYKPTRSVQTLTQAGFKEKTFHVRYDFEKLAVASASIEMIYQLLHDGEVNEPMYEFSENFLIWLNQTEQSVRNLFPYIQLRLAELMGIGIYLDVSSLKNNLSALYLNIDSGSVLGQQTNNPNLRLTPVQAHYLVLALQSRNSKVLSLNIDSGELKNLIRILDVYMKHHIEGLKDRTSDAIFEQIL
ncbi:MAG TPA: DNA repair protein RecO [Balneolales bacterium]|nr:DNA repair protein RecO [Balneolales bacterium]